MLKPLVSKPGVARTRRAGASEPQSEPEPAGGEGAFELVVIVFHHLLAGKAHTKEMEVLAAANEIRQMENGIFAGTLAPSMFDAAEARPALQFVRKD